MTTIDDGAEQSEKSVHVEVDRDRCEGHGLCTQVGPLVYELDDDGELIVREDGEVPEQLAGQAAAGARSCPVAALRISE